MIKHRDLAYAMRQANKIRVALDKANGQKQVRVLGPAPASLSRLKNEYRLQIIIRSPSRTELRETIDVGLSNAENAGCDLRTVNVEIDPVNLM
jgi:primosomal protein N' (replication factor Y)